MSTSVKEKIVIIGAGACGLAAAILLARDCQCDVTVFDALVDLDQKPEESYPIGVNARGLAVLEQINPSLCVEIKRSPGWITGWSVKTQMQELAFMDSGVVAGSTRGRVVMALYREALATAAAGHRIQFRLGHKLLAVDLAAHLLMFRAPDGESNVVVDVGDARVIDASGCWSKVRAAIAEVDESFVVELFPWRTTFRNMFSSHDVVVHDGLDPKAHHIFSTANMFASELLDGQWVFVVSSNEDNDAMAWLRSSEPTDDNVAQLKAFVYEHCPPTRTMLTDDAEFRRFFTRRAFSGQVVRVSRLHHEERWVLLGDAAHSVIPATGEGINSALEDVAVLVDALRRNRDRWFEAYNEARVADVRALGEYAAWLVDGLRAGQAERSTRTATTVVTAILKRVGLAGATIADQCYGRFSHQRRSYAAIVEDWKSQQRIIRPIGAAITFIPNLFAKD